MAIEDIRRALLAAVSSEELDTALADLLAERERTLWDAARQRLASPEYVVAIIGRQGVGKSSLINALVGRRILPVDETETTNVVCALRARGEGEERAVVMFLDGRMESGPAEDSFLRTFTDEQENPGNEQRVREVSVHLDSPLLGAGLTIVDTPGVGSLTESAGQVTMEFLPRISLGVFLIGTAPTLLESEALFLRATWAQSSNFLFVQNAWAASQAEIDDARDDNRGKLEAIAAEEGGGAVELLVVDVHRGLEGACNGHDGDVIASGLAALRSSLQERLDRGAAVLQLLDNGRTCVAVAERARNAGLSRLASLSSDDARDTTAFIGKQAAAYDELERIGSEWRAARAHFSEDKDALLTTFRADYEGAIAEAEKRLVGFAEERKLDAERLAKAMENELVHAARVSTGRLQSGFSRAVEHLETRARGLSDELETVVRTSIRVELPPGIRWTERIEGFGKGVQGLGKAALTAMGGAAVWAGGAALVAGEGLAAAVAAAGSAVPVVGWVVAAGALAAGYAIRKNQEGKAIRALVATIHKCVHDTRQRTLTDVAAAINLKTREIDAALDGEMRAALAQQRHVLEQLGHDHSLSLEQRQHLQTELEARCRLIDGVLASMVGLLERIAGGTP